MTASAFGLLIGAPAEAAQWRVQPGLTVIETFTDNVGLSPPGGEKSEFITQVNPSVFILGHGNRLDLNLAYTLQTRVHARERSRNDVNHQLAAGARAEVISEVLFVDTAASIAQRNISLLAPLGVDLTNDTANLADVRTYRVTPILRNRIGSFANYEVRYTRDSVSGGGSTFDSSNGNKLFTALTSGPSFGRLGWGLDYSHDKIDYERAPDVTLKTTTLRLRYAISPRFSLTATGGYEDNNYVYIGEKPSGRFWTAGFSWQPSSLTSLDASAGDRFFGRTYNMRFSHQSRAFVWSAVYSQDLTTSRSQFTLPQLFSTAGFLDSLLAPTVTDPLERALLVNALITSRGLPTTIVTPVNFFTARTFLDKRFNGSVAYSSGNTTVALNLFRSIRDAQAAGTAASIIGFDDFSTSSHITQTGGTVIFSYRLAPKTTGNFDLGYSRNEFRDTGQIDTIRYQRIGVGHAFTPRVTGRLDLRHTDRNSTSPGAEYNENAIIASIGMRF